jgi:hypothetical protein
MRTAQPFGRRGRPANLTSSGTREIRSSPALPPELLATILQPAEQSSAAERPKVLKVRWSFRGAVLAGLVAGLLSAAVKATAVLHLGGVLSEVPLGEAKVPFAVALAVAGLWGGARSSALVLLVAHSVLSRLGKTTYMAYALAGAAASLGYVLIAEILGFTAIHALIGDVLSGAAAGFFYRLFAATERGAPADTSLPSER